MSAPASVRPKRCLTVRPTDGGASGLNDTGAMAERVYKPRWHCRLHLYHRWRRHRVDDGGDSGGDYQARNFYQECLDCGKVRDIPIGMGGA
jgi:hypothetical protein